MKLIHLLFIITVIMLFAACSSSNSPDKKNITFKLAFDGNSPKSVAATTARALPFSISTSAYPSDFCLDHGDPDVLVTLRGSDGKIMRGDGGTNQVHALQAVFGAVSSAKLAKCSAHTGTILTNFDANGLSLRVDIPVFTDPAAINKVIAINGSGSSLPFNLGGGSSSDLGIINVTTKTVNPQPQSAVGAISALFVDGKDILNGLFAGMPNLVDPQLLFGIFVRTYGNYTINPSEDLDHGVAPSSLTSSTVLLTAPGGARVPLEFIKGTISPNANGNGSSKIYNYPLGSFRPTVMLNYNTTYTLTLNGVKDYFGRTIPTFSKTFTTASAPTAVPAETGLATLGNYWDQTNQKNITGNVLNWSAASGATGYNLYYGNTPTEALAKTNKFNATGAIVRPPYIVNKIGYYTIGAYNNFGETISSISPVLIDSIPY